MKITPKHVKLLSMSVVGLLLAILILQNRTPIPARFLWLTGEIPAILLLVLTAIGGVIVGLLLALYIRDRRK